MAAGVVSGGVANLLQAHPTWTPDQVKTQLVNRTTPVYGPKTDDARWSTRSGSGSASPT